MHRFLDWINETQYLWSQGLDTMHPVAAIFAVFGAGVLTSLTPCVYPMIPVTVAFMGGAAAGSRRRAFTLPVVYMLGLSSVYAALGILVAVLRETFGDFTRTPVIYGAVGVLMIVFALAMFDVISIPIPGFAGRVQAQGARRGGYLGALVMGCAAGFVAAPCTAPVFLTLLTQIATSTGAAGQGIDWPDVLWAGTLTIAFALGLGFLLMILGMFSGLVSSLPKPGPWMDRVKKIFGVLMLLVGAWLLFQAARMTMGLA